MSGAVEFGLYTLAHYPTVSLSGFIWRGILFDSTLSSVVVGILSDSNRLSLGYWRSKLGLRGCVWLGVTAFETWGRQASIVHRYQRVFTSNVEYVGLKELPEIRAPIEVFQAP